MIGLRKQLHSFIRRPGGLVLYWVSCWTRVCSLPSNGGDGWSKVQITFRAVGLFLIPSHIHLATGYRYIVESYAALQTFNASSRIDSEASTFVDQHITRFIIAILTAIVCGLPPAASNYEPQTTFLPRVSSRLAARAISQFQSETQRNRHAADLYPRTLSVGMPALPDHSTGTTINLLMLTRDDY
jgi:hypothetical protein